AVLLIIRLGGGGFLRLTRFLQLFERGVRFAAGHFAVLVEIQAFESALIAHFLSGDLAVFVLIVFLEQASHLDAAGGLIRNLVHGSEETIHLFSGKFAIVVLVEGVEQRDDLCKLLAGHLSIGVSIQKFAQALTKPRS